MMKIRKRWIVLAAVAVLVAAVGGWYWHYTTTDEYKARQLVNELREFCTDAGPGLVEGWLIDRGLMKEKEPRDMGEIFEDFLALGEAAVPALDKASKDKDPSMRYLAVNILSTLALGPGFPKKQAVPTLIEALKDSREDVRTRAADGLRLIGPVTKDVIPALTAALKHENRFTRSLAASPSIDRKNPPRLQVQVDYSKGKSAAWYPKGESPLLAELVKEGKLPPVADRVGPEPCVIKGIDGIGKYGGTWIRAATHRDELYIITYRLSYSTLLRFSPQGYPLVPHLAKSYSVSPDNKEFTFTLRKGVKWSDGHPFTADDIMYWWKHEANDKSLNAAPLGMMKIRDKYGYVEKLGKYKIRFVFPYPNGLFLAKTATYECKKMLNSPEHFLRKYHPKLGDQKLIAQYMKSRDFVSKVAVYKDVRDGLNPEHPRLWPWLYHTCKPDMPQTVIRNPYYWVVDPEGNQLPYVDRILFHLESNYLVGPNAALGNFTMQKRNIYFKDYKLLMDGRKKGGYDIYHWYSGIRSRYLINPNLNLLIDPKKPETRLKHELLNDKRFRQAMSIAINRKRIIDLFDNIVGEPAQAGPGPASFFYEPSLYKSFVKYDPKRANKMLDEIGLTKKDKEGYRTFKDGSRMRFFLNCCNWTGVGPGQFIVDDWAKVGIRVILRERSEEQFVKESEARLHEFSVHDGGGYFSPLYPRLFTGGDYALGYRRWFEKGGLYGAPGADPEHGCIEPPRDHPLRRSMELCAAASAHSDPVKQREIFRKVLKIAAENVWTINIATPPPDLAVVKNGFKNVPRNLVSSFTFLTPGNGGIETFHFEKPHDSPGAIRRIRHEIINITPRPNTP